MALLVRNKMGRLAVCRNIIRDVTVWEITKSVLIFLGIPLLAGFLTRLIGEARRGTDWYENTFLPRIGLIALYGLLFTIVILFALMWTGAFAAGLRSGLDYQRNTSIAFTAAGSDFELAIGVVGPLIEVPALVGRVNVDLWARHRSYPEPATASTRTTSPRSVRASRCF